MNKKEMLIKMVSGQGTIFSETAKKIIDVLEAGIATPKVYDIVINNIEHFDEKVAEYEEKLDDNYTDFDNCICENFKDDLKIFRLIKEVYYD